MIPELHEEVLLSRRSVRTSSCPSLYTLGGDTSHTERVIAPFDIRHLPEPLDFHSCLSIYRQISPQNIPFATVIDTLFSAVFYSYLWTPPNCEEVAQWLGEPITHTIIATPFRKFKASLPWLSTACALEPDYDSLCAEVLFSLFYIIDDINDQKVSRYGRQTSYGRFGKDANLRTWLTACAARDSNWVPSFLRDPDRIDLWERTILRLEISQEIRQSQTHMIPLSTYCEQSMERTAFLGDWWSRAAAKAGQPSLASWIESVYPHCALAGQIRNDLRNTDDRETTDGGTRFSDFYDGKISTITILTFDMADRQDQSWIREHVWKRPTGANALNAQRLFNIIASCGALSTAKRHLCAQIDIIERATSESWLPTATKYLWLGWVFRQFRVGVVANRDLCSKDTAKFIQAVAELAPSTH